jgi:hypothetical protein
LKKKVSKVVMDRLKDLPALPAAYVDVLLARTSFPAPTQKFDVQTPDSPGARLAKLTKLLERGCQCQI